MSCRYRESRGVSIKKFLKFCRDALLIDNSWTYYDAILAFDQLATDDADDDHFGSFAEEEEEYSSRFLDYDSFIEALRRIARQSSAVEDTAQLVKSHIPPVEAKDAVAVKWFAFRHYVGETLHASPKSDDDFLLMEFIFSEPVIRMIVENEYKFRRAYKRLAKQMGKIPKWEDLATHRTMKMDQNSVQKFLRELVGKEHGGPIRQEDWSTALRASNHETTSKDTSAKTSGETTLPELMEMVFRCAMGGTLIGWSMRDENAEDGSDKRYFDTERDTPASACERIEIILEFVWDWLEAERERDDKPDEDHTVLMEECPLYDTVHADLQRIFVHYSTGAQYTDNMDHTNPLVMMPSENLFRFCRDSGFMDARVTYSAIFDRYTSLGQGKGPWQLRSINYAFFCRLLSGLARLKYEEARAVVAITMLLEQWLVPMVNIPSQSNELKEFMFTEQMLSFFLIYELHVGKMFDKHATIREVLLESSGVVNIPGSVAASALQEPHRRIIKQVLPSLGEEEPEKEEKKNFRRKQVKSMTLIDLNGFLKTLGFVPDMLTVDEVPEIYDTVVASTPHLQMAVSDSTMCLSQLLEALTSAALIMYSRPPYSSKYATREEKVLATLERVEVCYYSLFKKFMPLEPKVSFPSADLTLIGVSKESQLRDFLITRRMERGMSLVSVSAKTHLVSETEGNVGGGNLGSREYAPVPERSDGRRPVALGMPSIIREQLFAPEAPYPVGPLMETALIHHNAARYKASVETYLQALNTWNSMLLEEGNKGSGTDQATAEGGGTSGQAIDDIQLLFFFTSLGGVYESAGLDELALACYTLVSLPSACCIIPCKYIYCMPAMSMDSLHLLPS